MNDLLTTAIGVFAWPTLRDAPEATTAVVAGRECACGNAHRLEEAGHITGARGLLNGPLPVISPLIASLHDDLTQPPRAV